MLVEEVSVSLERRSDDAVALGDEVKLTEKDALSARMSEDGEAEGDGV